LDGGSSIISFCVIAGLFAAIYKLMPDARIEWRDVILGGAVTSLLFTIGKQLLGFYLGRASYTSTYGAAASVVVLIVWVYYSSQVFFLGAEFTKAFASRYGSRHIGTPEKLVQLASEPKPGGDHKVITSADAGDIENASSAAQSAGST
jgi:membrane protein